MQLRNSASGRPSVAAFDNLIWPTPMPLFSSSFRVYCFPGAAEPGTAYMGGGGRTVSGDDAWGAIRALEGTTGKIKWEFKLLSPGWTSLLSTAGGLVFAGTEEGKSLRAGC
jgi:outer membrane protein assembly factor BamB